MTKGQWFSQSCLYNETSIKPTSDGCRELPGWRGSMEVGWEGGMLGEGMEAPPPSQEPCPVHLWHWLFLSGILYNKPVMTVSKMFSRILWAVLANYWRRGGATRNAGQSKGLGLATGIWRGGEAGGPVGSDPNSRDRVSELHWIELYVSDTGVKELVGVWKNPYTFGIGSIVSKNSSDYTHIPINTPVEWLWKL